MKKVEYHLNDYVINDDNKICKVVGTRLSPCNVIIDEPKQMLTLFWQEEKDGKCLNRVQEVEALKVCGWEWSLSILTAIGFKKGESLHTLVFNDRSSKKSIVFDRTDGSVYVFKSSRHIMMDFMYADYVHDIQHIFDQANVVFPNLYGWLYVENARRKPPVKLNQY